MPDRADIRDFRSLLSRAGMSQSELARRLGVFPSTVSGWGDDPPEYALTYLELYVSMRRIAQEQLEILERLK